MSILMGRVGGSRDGLVTSERSHEIDTLVRGGSVRVHPVQIKDIRIRDINRPAGEALGEDDDLK